PPAFAECAMINLRRFTRSPRLLAHAALKSRCREAAPLDELGADLGRAQQRRGIKNLSPFADWPNVAVRSKLLIKCSVGLALGPARFLMHGVVSQMCVPVATPLLDLGAGGRSPGYLGPLSKQVASQEDCKSYETHSGSTPAKGTRPWLAARPSTVT